MKKFKSIDGYLNFLGSNRSYSRKLISCEVCSSNEFTLIREYTDSGLNNLAPLPVKACNKCGFIMQNPRFEKKFYDDYYSELYPKVRAYSQSNDKNDKCYIKEGRLINKDGSITDFAFINAKERAKNLYNYLKKKNLIPEKQSLLDVGCGVGGFMHYFKGKGFHVRGNDPDETTVKEGNKNGLKIDLINGEDMSYSEKFGIVIIIGSLEHVYNPNIILEKCYEYLVEGGIIVIEGRYTPVSESFRWLNSTHHRFLTNEGAQLILLKNGFTILESTTFPVCGDNTGRKGGGFAIARKIQNNSLKNIGSDKFIKIISKMKLLKKPSDLLKELEIHDKKIERTKN